MNSSAVRTTYDLRVGQKSVMARNERKLSFGQRGFYTVREVTREKMSDLSLLLSELIIKYP